ncbi:MAG: hypothetical protein RQ737_10970, partial [Bacteroidales bacterium]|nr:hypothetical protein [Bacteroidales bacterium]
MTETKNWRLLASHHGTIKHISLRELFTENNDRVNDFNIEAKGILFDYSKHRINDKNLSLLLGLARERGLEERIRVMFSGEKTNETEQWAVLHTALHAPRDANIRTDGESVSCRTGPIFWGEPGTYGQHSFYQLLQQGTHLVPADFIGFKEVLHTLPHHQDYLIVNMIAQGEALAFGKTADEVRSDGVPESLIPLKVFEGNRPSSTFFLDKLTPETLGKLIAIYEHSVFVQGVIWGVISFDRMAVNEYNQVRGYNDIFAIGDIAFMQTPDFPAGHPMVAQ